MFSKPIKTHQDVHAVESGDLVVMSCPKCKTVTVTKILGGLKNRPGESVKVPEDVCPGCGNYIGVEGHGKAKKNTVTHKCRNCGSKDAWCCVVKKGAAATPGMEEKK